MKKKRSYASTARRMVRVADDPESVEIGRRYLSVARRIKVVRAAIAREYGQVRSRNPLVVSGFRAPLSVAGRADDGETMSLARRLLRAGIPIAVQFDGSGGHRGTSIDDAVERLRAVDDRPWSDAEVIALYAAMMISPARVLETDPRRRVAILGHCANRLAIQQSWMKRRIDDAIASRERPHRFSAIVRRERMAEAMQSVAEEVEYVTLGFRDNVLSVNRVGVECDWGRGSGLVVVARQALVMLLAVCKHAMTIEFGADSWAAWPDSVPDVGGRDKSISFAYFTGDAVE